MGKDKDTFVMAEMDAQWEAAMYWAHAVASQSTGALAQEANKIAKAIKTLHWLLTTAEKHNVMETMTEEKTVLGFCLRAHEEVTAALSELFKVADTVFHEGAPALERFHLIEIDTFAIGEYWLWGDNTHKTKDTVNHWENENSAQN